MERDGGTRCRLLRGLEAHGSFDDMAADPLGQLLVASPMM